MKIALGLILLLPLLFAQNEAKFKKPNLAQWIKIPSKIKGLTLQKLQSLKQKLGENRFVRLKHLFLINPQMAMQVLAGHESLDEQMPIDDQDHFNEDDLELVDAMESTTIEPLEDTTEIPDDEEDEDPEDVCDTKMCQLKFKHESRHVHVCIHLVSGMIGEFQILNKVNYIC